MDGRASRTILTIGESPFLQSFLGSMSFCAYQEHSPSLKCDLDESGCALTDSGYLEE